MDVTFSSSARKSLAGAALAALFAAGVGTIAYAQGGAAGAAAAAAGALPGGLSAAGPLLSSLGAAVPGLSQAQSILGAGSLLGLAKAKMPADQFSKLSSSVPGTDALVGEAVKQGLPSSLGSLADVTSFLGKSGINADQVTKLVPAFTKAAGGKLTPDVAASLASALK